MKILVVSDTHRKNDNYLNVVQQTQARIDELKESCKKLEANIKDIPKEITVRNVLKLP